MKALSPDVQRRITWRAEYLGMFRRVCILALAPVCLWLGYRTLYADSKPDPYILPILFASLALLLLVLLVVEFGERARAALHQHDVQVNETANRKTLRSGRGSGTARSEQDQSRNSPA